MLLIKFFEGCSDSSGFKAVKELRYGAALKDWTTKKKEGFAPHKMVDLYVSQGVDLGRGGSPSRNGVAQYEKWPE